MTTPASDGHLTSPKPEVAERTWSRSEQTHNAQWTAQRGGADRTASGAQVVLRLQRTAGNRAVAGVVTARYARSGPSSPQTVAQRSPGDEKSCAIDQTVLVYHGKHGQERCITENDSEFRQDYIDNNIVEATGLAVPDTTWENIDHDRFPRIRLTYKDRRTLVVDVSDIPLQLSGGAPRGPTTVRALRPLARYEKRSDGFIYPMRSIGSSYYVSYGDASNIVSLRAGLHDQIEQLKKMFLLIQLGAGFAKNIAALGGIAALNRAGGGLFKPVPKKQTSPGKGTVVPGSKGRATTSTPSSPLRGPAARHTASRVSQRTLAKENNTVIEPGVDVAGDVAAINAGKAVRQGNSWTVNGRTYGVHQGALYPVAGPGFHQLSRGAFKVLGILNNMGNTPRASAILHKVGFSAADRSAALRVFEAINK